MAYGDFDRAWTISIKAADQEVTRTCSVTSPLLAFGHKACFVRQPENEVLHRSMSPGDAISVATNEVVTIDVHRTVAAGACGCRSHKRNLRDAKRPT